jgi:hypothetical protein
MAADVLHASREELLPALRRSSELLVTELDRFEALLADLLEISRLDAGVAELVAERVDLRAVVLRAVDNVRGLAEDSGTELRLDLPEGVEAEVDPRRVERIVRNLVANAVDHGEGRPVDVRLAGDASTVAVLVRDHGVGLRPGEASLVFNRFWRAEESRPGAAAAAGWACRSASRTPGCTAACSRRGRPRAGVRVPADPAARGRGTGAGQPAAARSRTTTRRVGGVGADAPRGIAPEASSRRSEVVR